MKWMPAVALEPALGAFMTTRKHREPALALSTLFNAPSAGPRGLGGASAGSRGHGVISRPASAGSRGTAGELSGGCCPLHLEPGEVRHDHCVDGGQAQRHGQAAER